MSRKSVQGGYCLDTDDCALERNDCIDPSQFRSTRQIRGGIGDRCLWDSAVTSQKLGKCIDATGQPTHCAPNVDSCPAWDGSHQQTGFVPEDSPASPPRDWVGPSLDCGVELDVFGNQTLYGRCDYGMCAWSHEHCTEDNTWEAFSEGCTCDTVQVGGCSSMDPDGAKTVYCAVSGLACDDEQTWIVPQEVKRAAGFDCYLCRAGPATTESDRVSNSSNDPTLDPGLWSLIGVGVFFVVFTLGVVGCRMRTARKNAQRQQDSGPSTGTMQIIANEIPNTADVIE